MGLLCAKNASKKFSRLGTFKSRGSKTDLIKLQKLYKKGRPTSSSSVSQPTSDSQGLCVVRKKHWRSKKLTMAI
jgi:hypothetical protein